MSQTTPGAATPSTDLRALACQPMFGRHPGLLRAVRAEGVNPHRVHAQEVEGQTLRVFYTEPYDSTTYMATIDLGSVAA